MTSDPLTPFEFRHRLTRVQAQDATALGELYSVYGDLVYRTAYRLSRHQPDAEDITQDVFLRLPSVLGGFTGLAENFAGWLRRVTVRHALVHLRTGRRRREVDVEMAGALFGRNDGVADRITLETALGRLDQDHRVVFLLKEVEGYAHNEIAELLGISPANSEVRLHRARKQLRELLRSSR